MTVKNDKEWKKTTKQNGTITDRHTVILSDENKQKLQEKVTKHAAAAPRSKLSPALTGVDRVSSAASSTKMERISFTEKKRGLFSMAYRENS